MKKSIFLLGLAAFALASCSNEESTTGGSNGSNTISFGTFVEKATKGTPVAGTTFPVGNDFLVIGYSTGTANLVAPAAPNFMRQAVTKTDATTYSYLPLRYWPSATGSKLSFFAVAPASVATMVTPTAIATTAEALPVVTYAVPAEPVDQKDLMLASTINKTQPDGTAAFAFTHALTKIGFTAKLAADYGVNGTYIRITNISLKNVAGTGVFSFAADGTYSLTAPSVFTSTFALDYLKHMVDNGSVSSTTKKTMILDNSYLMMVPCTYDATTGATAALEVTYTITNADGASTTVTSSTLLQDLTVGDGNVWAAAKSITYNLTITLNAVSFSADMTDWGANNDVEF